MKYRIFTCSAAAIALLVASCAPVMAQSVITNTYTQSQEIEGAQAVDFSVLDLNQDGAYSMVEVGEYLFKAFDQDGNSNIDNIEWDKKKIITVTPMEKETFRYIDHTGNGMIDETTYTYETFFEASGLLKFDKDLDGLSAADFIDTGYQELDDNDDQLISMEEWKAAYLGSRPAHMKQDNYN